MNIWVWDAWFQCRELHRFSLCPVLTCTSSSIIFSVSPFHLHKYNGYSMATSKQLFKISFCGTEWTFPTVVYCWLLSHVQTTAWNHKIVQQDEFVPHPEQHRAPLLLPNPATFTLLGLRWFLSQLFLSSKTQISCARCPRGLGMKGVPRGFSTSRVAGKAFPFLRIRLNLGHLLTMKSIKKTQQL